MLNLELECRDANHDTVGAVSHEREAVALQIRGAIEAGLRECQKRGLAHSVNHVVPVTEAIPDIEWAEYAVYVCRSISPQEKPRFGTSEEGLPRHAVAGQIHVDASDGKVCVIAQERDDKGTGCDEVALATVAGYGSEFMAELAVHLADLGIPFFHDNRLNLAS